MSKITNDGLIFDIRALWRSGLRVT